MASDKKKLREALPSVLRRVNWRAVRVVVVRCLVLLITVTIFFGPTSRGLYEDPLTGRRLRETIWLGMFPFKQIEETEVSRWADEHSNPEVYPGRFGWNLITQTNGGWFGLGAIRCGGGFRIPDRISRGEIAVDGQKPEDTLRQYQSEYIAAYNEQGLTREVQYIWSAKAEPR